MTDPDTKWQKHVTEAQHILNVVLNHDEFAVSFPDAVAENFRSIEGELPKGFFCSQLPPSPSCNTRYRLQWDFIEDITARENVFKAVELAANSAGAMDINKQRTHAGY